MINPFAYFDSLSICRRLQNTLGNVAIAEIYLFAYLSCLLSLYKKLPASSWEYQFSITKEGYPYSIALDTSVQDHINNGLLIGKEYYLELTESGKEVYNQLRTLELNYCREPFIEGACSTILAMPVGIIRKSLSQESVIKSALELSQSRMLLTDAEQGVIYEQFSTLSSVIGMEVKELIVPALVWLKCLSEQEDFESGSQTIDIPRS